jgi:hypothetical protein
MRRGDVAGRPREDVKWSGPPIFLRILASRCIGPVWPTAAASSPARPADGGTCRCFVVRLALVSFNPLEFARN